MSTGGYKITDQGAIYFVSFAVVGWVDVFTIKEYRDIIIESLKHCQENKGMVIYGWCIMTNHLHHSLTDIVATFFRLTVFG